MDLEEFLRDWNVGEAEIRHIDWRRQYRDLVLRIHGVRDRHLPPEPGDKHGYLRAVNGELTFVSCARACFDRSIEFVDSQLAEWGSGAWTVVAIVEDEKRWPDREDLVGDGFRFIAVNVVDGRIGWDRDWIHIVCRELTFQVLGPVTDMETPLRP
jgi:hypothetical protein